MFRPMILMQTSMLKTIFTIDRYIKKLYNTLNIFKGKEQKNPMKKYKRGVTVEPFDQFSRTVYTTEQGLQSDIATALVFDNEGTLYVGTDKGLSRLDGDKFKEVNLGVGETSVGMLYCADNNHIIYAEFY